MLRCGLRRAALVGWAKRVDGVVLEDGYDSEFR
jgi:DNA-binding transcriptional MocR family regulator